MGLNLRDSILDFDILSFKTENVEIVLHCFGDQGPGVLCWE